MFRRCVFGAMALWLIAPAAGAAPLDYCKAYAIDFADQTKRDTAYWKQRFDDAEKACLAQFSFDEPAAKPAPQKVAKAKPKPKPAVSEKPEETTSLAETELAEAAPPAAHKKPRLEEGSVAWLDYCDRKYTSFNRKTGTYLSRTGVERKCLVTSNFQ